MIYQPPTPEYPAPGEPYSAEAATHPDDIFEPGRHHLVSLIPAKTEQDEEILLSIKQGFERERIVLQTPHDFAAASLREYLDKQGIADDPDDLILTTLYLENANMHAGPWRAQVAHSMTLTQALIGNWQQQGSGSWDDHLGYPKAWRREGYEVSQTTTLAAGQLADSAAYDGIYRRTTPQTFGAATQVNLDPVAFRKFVWDAELQGHYLTYLRHFWSQQGHSYHLLLKGNLVHAALLQREEGSLGTEHVELVLKSLMLNPNTSWEGTSFRYFADNPVSPSRTISALKIYGYEASDIMVFGEHGQDHKVLYIPGNSSPLHGFASAHELRDWITQQCCDPRKRAALASHFCTKDRADGNFFSGVDTALAGLAAYPRRLNDATGHWYPSSTISFGDALYPYPMSHFRDRIKDRLHSDAEYDIGTQGAYYRKLTAYGVEMAANVIGAIALAVPALAPVAVALGAGLLAVGAGEMITAHTPQEQTEGAQRIAFGLLNALPLAGELSQAKAAKATLSEAERAAAEAAETEHAAQAARDTNDGGIPSHAPETAEYKAVRPVHDSLQSDKRSLLKTIAVTRRVRVLGGGKGTFLDEGKLYVRIRPEVYRVQWLENEQQFRIRSEGEPVVWGPFLTCMDNGYWDIDPRLGLRGGSYNTKVFDPAPLPVELVAGIERQPLIPKVEVSIAVDDLIWSEEFNCYQADVFLGSGSNSVEGESTRLKVWYDADSVAWRSGDDQYVWREAHGSKGTYRWRKGSARDYERVRHKVVPETYVTDYRFPDLPQLPKQMAPIPQDIHMIWVGEKELGVEIKQTIVKNLRHKPLRFIMHLDNAAPAMEANTAWCEEVGIQARNLREQPFFQEFVQGPQGRAYNYFRNPTAASRNYAAASDYLRIRVVDEFGGCYMDIDDELLAGTAPPLMAAPNDVLCGNQYVMPWSKKGMVNNSHFASHRNNPVLKRLLEDANARYDALPDSFKNTPRPVFDNLANPVQRKQMYAYMQVISNLAGPDAFNKGMRMLRPDYFALMKTKPFPAYAWVRSKVYQEFWDEVIAHWFPFRAVGGQMGIRSGNAHTWMQT